MMHVLFPILSTPWCHMVATPWWYDTTLAPVRHHTPPHSGSPQPQSAPQGGGGRGFDCGAAPPVSPQGKKGGGGGGFQDRAPHYTAAYLGYQVSSPSLSMFNNVGKPLTPQHRSSTTFLGGMIRSTEIGQVTKEDLSEIGFESFRRPVDEKIGCLS